MERKSRLSRGPAAQIGFVLALVAMTASLWWAWFAWDSTYQRDPATGEISGPYELWQGLGCGICWVALAIVAQAVLRPWVVVVVMPLSFAAAYSLTVLPADETGLAGVGVLMVAAGTTLGTLATVGAAWGIRRITDQCGD